MLKVISWRVEIVFSLYSLFSVLIKDNTSKTELE